MTFYPNDRTALFIDGANLYSAARALNIDIDYKKLLDEFRKRGVLMRAYYYTAVVEEQEYSPLRPLVDWLDYNGFTMVTKPARRYVDSSTGQSRTKGNMDIEIAVDMLEMAGHLDHAVLFSGDGDFRRLVEAVQRKGVRVTRGLHGQVAAAHGRRRAPPPGRRLRRPGRPRRYRGPPAPAGHAALPAGTRRA